VSNLNDGGTARFLIPPPLFSYWEEDDAAGEITIKKKHKNTKMMSQNKFFFGHVRMVNEVFFNTIF
jgi:hypothetical protein